MSRLFLVLLSVCASLSACKARSPEPLFVKEQTAAEPAAAPTPAPQAPKVAIAAGEPAPAQTTAPDSASEKSAAGVDASVPSPPVAPAFSRHPTTPDPLAGKFTLADATAGMPKGSKLHAKIETGYGNIECSLSADKTPNTVANFVGLARGLRPFWDPKASAWVKRPLFDGTSFHRAIADFMIQGGDHLGDGTGQVGYEIPDELVGLKHDRAGLLCMANRGPNTNGGQFFITDAAAPHLTSMNTYTIFGECRPTDVIHRIATAPRPSPMSERPEPVIPISKVTISR